MGPLHRNKDELLQELSSAPASPGSSVASSTPDKSAGAVIAAVIPAVASFLSNIWTNRRNEELAEQQNEWNLQQWRRENAYNDPRNQIARLAAAGINPALAYANGDLMNEAAASPQMTSAFGRITSPVQIDPLTAAQINNLNASADEARAGAEDKLQSANARKISSAIDGMTYEAMKDNFELYKKSFEAENQSAINASRLSSLQYYELCWDLAIMFGTNPSNLELSASSTGYTDSNDGVVFPFSKDAWDRAKSVFKGNQELELKVQEVESFMKGLEKEQHKKDKEFWEGLNKAAEDPDNWMARAALYALVILQQRSGASSFAFNFSRPKIFRNSSTTNNIGSQHNTRIWHKHSQ